MLERVLETFWEQWGQLAEIGRDEEGGTSRVAWNPPDVQARRLVARWMEDNGLTTTVDGLGNVIGQRGGPPFILTGSHTDTVPRGGNFDGVVGVLAGLALARVWPQNARHGLLVVDWAAEESSRFGVGTIGSRVALGELDTAVLALQDHRGITLGQALSEAWGTPRGPVWRVPTADVHAATELHIEQSDELVTHDLPTAVVAGIAAPQRWLLEVHGRTDHSGGAPYSQRRDALAAASAIVLEVERLGREGESQGLRATVTRSTVSPGATNIVPGRVDLLVDVRAQSQAVLKQFTDALDIFLTDMMRQRMVRVERRVLIAEDPGRLDPTIQNVLRLAIRKHGLDALDLPSWPSHDSLGLSRHVPTGMLFVRNVSGRSHSPEEQVDRQDIATGLAIFLNAVIELDTRCPLDTRKPAHSSHPA
jgi:N-carbamoyl-L-amino-acid hydrolase